MLSSSLGRELQRIGSGFMHVVIELSFGEISKDGLNLRAIISNFVVFSCRYRLIEREEQSLFLRVFNLLKYTKSGSCTDNTSNSELCFFAGLAQGENKVWTALLHQIVTANSISRLNFEVTHLRGRFE